MADRRNLSPEASYEALVGSFDHDNNRLRVDGSGVTQPVSGSVTVTGEVEIKNDSGNALPVSATNLDIRDLTFATDKVDASGTTLGANSGVDIGDVTINNSTGASAVNIQDGGNSITVDGTVTATQSGTWTEANSATIATNTGNSATALQIMDDWDESDRAKVNPIVGQAGVAAGSGTISATTQRVVLATDQPVIPVSDNGGSLTVDGTVAATQSGTWNTGAGSANIVIDSNNSTTTPLTAGATFMGTATDILAYSQVNIKIYSEPAGAKATFYFEFSDDNTNWDISVPSLIRTGTLVIPIPVINVGRYFRVKYVNDGGVAAIAALGLSDTAGTPTAQTVFRMTSYLHPTATKELTRTLDQAIQGSDAVSVVRAVSMGRLPNGNYSNVPGRGRSSSNNTTSTLTANSVYTGTFEATTGYVSISVLVNTDQTSAAEGVEVQHSDDGTNVRFTDKFAYGSTEVTNGYGYYTVPARSDYVRVKYTNGGTGQGTFRLNTYLSPTILDNIETTVEAPISSSNTTEIGRSLVLAKNAAGAYGNVERGTSGGLDIGIVQHEVDTPIKPLDNATGGQTSVLTSATQIDTSQLTNRKGIVVKALNSNNQKIYVGFSSGVTTGNGYELDAGQFVELDLSTSKTIWAIANSSTQTASWVQVAT